MSTDCPTRELIDLVARLRAPDGCPWDRDQQLADVRAYLLEEAHEVAAAIDRGDPEELRGELGDLLFQVVFVARLMEERGAFDLDEVTRQIVAKMIDRHPHVFGDEELDSAAEVAAAWERRKLAGEGRERSLLGGLSDTMPALLTAYRMTQKAAGVGFDWPDRYAVLDKVREETAEVSAELDAEPCDRERLEDELGDLLFSVANLARHLRIDPEAALARANRKFRRRFGEVERALTARGRALADAELDEMDELWRQIKAEERGRTP